MANLFAFWKAVIYTELLIKKKKEEAVIFINEQKKERKKKTLQQNIVKYKDKRLKQPILKVATNFSNP